MSASEALRLAFIGGSIQSAIGYTHFTASRMDGLFTLVAGCFSRDAELNLQSAKTYGVERVYPDYLSLLREERERIDAVVILTPIPSHYEIIRAALDLGVPVISEKALALSSAECRSIEDCVHKNQAYLAVTLNYSAYPMVRQLRKMVQDGQFGELQQMVIEMPQESFLRDDLNAQAWRQRDYYVPTVSLDLGVHVHHLLHFVSGLKPLSVSADRAAFGKLPKLIDSVHGFAHYENNVRVQVWWGKTALGQRNGLRIRVYGSQGSAQWSQMDPEFLHWADNQGHCYILDRASKEATLARESRYNRFKAGHPSGFIEAFANLYTDLAQDLTAFKQAKARGEVFQRHPYVFGVDHAIDGLAFIEAMDQSARQQQWVHLQSFEDYWI